MADSRKEHLVLSKYSLRVVKRAFNLGVWGSLSMWNFRVSWITKMWLETSARETSFFSMKS